MNDKIDTVKNNILLEENDLEEIFEDDPWTDYIPEEDPERSVSNQELINVLEESITKLETLKGKKQSEQIVKTLILVCKILSVELNKSTFEDSGEKTYIS